MTAGAVGAATQRFAVFGSSIVAATCLPWLTVLAAHHAGVTDGRLFVAAGVATGAHVATTGLFYGDRELGLVARDWRRYVVAPILAVAVAVLLFASGQHVLIAAAVVVQQTWQIHHFTRQNLGVFALWAKWRGGAGLSDRERRIFDLTTYAGALGLLQLPLPYGYRLPAADLIRVAGFGCLLAAVVLVILERPLPSWRLAGLACAVVFYLPVYLYSPTLLVATAAYGFAHGAQYLVMMSHLRGGRAQPRAWMWQLVAVVVVVGFPLRWMGERTGAWLGLAIGLSVAHFVIDAGVWKMRTPEQRAYMGARMPWLTQPRR